MQRARPKARTARVRAGTPRHSPLSRSEADHRCQRGALTSRTPADPTLTTSLFLYSRRQMLLEVPVLGLHLVRPEVETKPSPSEKRCDGTGLRRTTQRPFTFPIGSPFWGMRTSKAHSADAMCLSFSEVFGAQRSTAMSANTDGCPSVASQSANKAVHSVPSSLIPYFRFRNGPARLPTVGAIDQDPVLAAELVQLDPIHVALLLVALRHTSSGCPRERVNFKRYDTCGTNWATRPMAHSNQGECNQTSAGNTFWDGKDRRD